MNPILLPLTQAAVPSSRTWFDNPAIQNKLGYALVETLAMTFVSGAITVILGLLLGLALVSTGKRGQFRNPALYWVLSQIVNIGRSMPFIILMVALIPITRMLVGTSLGWQAACVPLTIGAIPFYARLVETAINDVDHGKVEAALMMGASGRQITWGVLVREAPPPKKDPRNAPRAAPFSWSATSPPSNPFSGRPSTPPPTSTTGSTSTWRRYPSPNSMPTAPPVCDSSTTPPT